MGLWDDITSAIAGVPAAVSDAAQSVASTAADIPGALEGVPKQLDQWGKDALGAVSGVPSAIGADLSWDASKLGALFGGGGTPPAPAAQKPGGVVPTPPNPTQDAGYRQVDVANQAMDQLIAQYTAALGTTNPYIAGQMGGVASSKATQIGQAIGGSGVQAENPANNAALNADAQAFEASNAKGAAGITKALGDVRSANAQALQVSPYAGALSALTTGATYKAEGLIPGSSVGGGLNVSAQTPQWLKDAYSTAIGSNPGVSTPGGSAGATAATTPSTNNAGVTGGP